MSIKGCIFDLDGVIVDTAHYHYLSWQKLAAKFDFKFTIEDNERLKGISRMDSLNIVLEIADLDFSETEKIKLCALKNTWYKESIDKLTPADALPGVRSFLDYLKEENIKIGLGSASKNARPVLESLQLTHYFDAHVDGNDVSKSKPDPEVFVKGAELLGLQAQEIIVFEDSRKGLEAAITGGFIPVGVGPAELLPEASFHISTFEKLNLNILEKVSSL